MSQCDKCGFRHGQGPCCIDIYQQLGNRKGPPILSQVLLAFVLPVFIFVCGLALMNYVLSFFMSSSGLRTFLVFIFAVVITLIFVQLIRVCTRKPINSNMTHK